MRNHITTTVQTFEHGASNAKVTGSIRRECMIITYKMYTSAKCKCKSLSLTSVTSYKASFCLLVGSMVTFSCCKFSMVYIMSYTGGSGEFQKGPVTSGSNKTKLITSQEAAEVLYLMAYATWAKCFCSGNSLNNTVNIKTNQMYPFHFLQTRFWILVCVVQK